MFADLDESIRELLVHDVLEPLELAEVDVSFDAPDREWSGKLSRPTVNCFLYDVRENEEMHEAAWDITRDQGNWTAARRQHPMWVNTTYNITVWANAPEDEHRLLWSVLSALARYRALPGSIMQGALTNWYPVRTHVARPEQARTSAADLWQALDNRIRPSLTYVATVALDPDVALQPVKMARSAIFRLRWGGGFEVKGYVRNHRNQRPVGGVSIRPLDAEQDQKSITAADGSYTLELPRGQVRLAISARGRAEVTRTLQVPSKDYDLEV